MTADLLVRSFSFAITVLITAFLLGPALSAQQVRGNPRVSDTSDADLARENLKTQQILAQYLQRRLFPHLHLQQHLAASFPTTPKQTTPSRHPNKSGKGDRDQDDLGADDLEESLQSFESEQITFVDDLAAAPREEGKLPEPKAPVTRSIQAEPGVHNQLIHECTSANCLDDGVGLHNRWTMPLLKLGEKRFYLGIFFKANWYRASQYCRYHGMHLASIGSQEENDKLEKHIRDFGLGHEHFWTSGTDQAEEGSFFWMATGRPVTFVNWNTGEPNNFRYENGEEEHCLELWNRDGKGLKWNDSPCSFETFFVCEV